MQSFIKIRFKTNIVYKFDNLLSVIKKSKQVFFIVKKDKIKCRRFKIVVYLNFKCKYTAGMPNTY
jgi:hypothetical protein